MPPRDARRNAGAAGGSNRGCVVFRRYASGRDATDTFPASSMAKSMTHAAIGILLGEGRVDLRRAMKSQPLPYCRLTAEVRGRGRGADGWFDRKVRRQRLLAKLSEERLRIDEFATGYLLEGFLESNFLVRGQLESLGCFRDEDGYRSLLFQTADLDRRVYSGPLEAPASGLIRTRSSEATAKWPGQS